MEIDFEKVKKWALESPYAGFVENKALIVQLYKKLVLKENVSFALMTRPIKELEIGKTSKIRVVVVDIEKIKRIGCGICYKMFSRDITECSDHGAGAEKAELTMYTIYAGDESSSVIIKAFPKFIRGKESIIENSVGKILELQGFLSDSGSFILTDILSVESQTPVQGKEEVAVKQSKKDEELNTILKTTRAIIGINEKNITVEELKNYLSNVKKINADVNEVIKSLGAVVEDGYVIIRK